MDLTGPVAGTDTNLVLKLPVNFLNTSVPNRCERSTKALMDSATKALGNLAPDIPSHKIKLVVHVLAGASLLDSVDLGDARRLPLQLPRKMLYWPPCQSYRSSDSVHLLVAKPVIPGRLSMEHRFQPLSVFSLIPVDLQYLLTFSCVKFTPNHIQELRMLPC